jgi:ribosomal protein S27E
MDEEAEFALDPALACDDCWNALRTTWFSTDRKVRCPDCTALYIKVLNGTATTEDLNFRATLEGVA